MTMKIKAVVISSKRPMKDSQVKWMGQIPETWTTPKLLYVLSERISDGPHETPAYIDEGIPFISIDSLNDSKNINFENVKRYISEEDYMRYCKKTVIREGDILFSKAATIGKTAIVGKERFMVWSPLAIIKGDYHLVDNAYLYYLLNCDELIQTIALSGSMNTQINVGMREMEQARIPVPPLKEQRSIAHYLDTVCPCIDSAVEKTSEAIEEYKKLKQSIITEAVTQGIRPNREWKNSGNIWFEHIPYEWGMKRIKYLFSIQKHIAGKEGYTVLSITQKGIVPKNLSTNEGQLADSYKNYQWVHIGDFAMNHMDLLTGWVDISKYEGVTSPDYRVFSLKEKEEFDSQYYLYVMQMCYMNKIFYALGQGVSGMGRWRLQTDKFLNFTVPVPPINEQREIVEFLNGKCQQIDAIIRKKEQYLIELKSLKKALIYEFVTGKKEAV